MTQIIDILSTIVKNNHDEINNWFEGRYNHVNPFFYSSVDLRNSGHKIVPVDTNLFPAGFNTLSKNAQENAAQKTQEYLKKYYPDAKNILIIPENHTRNLFYLENVAVLRDIIMQAGMDVTVGGFENSEKLCLVTSSDRELIIEPIQRKGDIVTVGQKRPDVIIVNNDMSTGAPQILQNINQLVLPPVGMGWYRRRKTAHFDSYHNISRIFANKFEFDPWLISAYFSKCGKINFKERKGLECVAINVEKTLHRISKKYQEYGIEDKPYVFIKADSGTYGMGIMTVSSPEEVFEINKNSRKKMNKIKEGVTNQEVIIQEGIATIDTVSGNPAEPMIYLIGGNAISQTMRVNKNKDNKGNLNSVGMVFQNSCESDDSNDNDSDICAVQALVAKLATVATIDECYENDWNI